MGCFWGLVFSFGRLWLSVLFEVIEKISSVVVIGIRYWVLGIVYIGLE